MIILSIFRCIVIEIAKERYLRIYFKIKRYLDYIFAGLVFIFMAPVFLLLVILVAAGGKGPVFFKQERLGYNGNIFTIFKFRTMIAGASKIGSGNLSYKDDPRVTRIGRFLRASGLDELPQLINIIKGEMSFIGPRPMLPNHPLPYKDYTQQQRKRFDVYPGISGLAQINGRRTIPCEERFIYDVEYVEHLSFGLDIKIFFKTIFTVFSNNNHTNIESTKASKAEQNKV